MSDKIIKVQDTLYYILGTMSVESSNERGTEYWKQQWGANAVLRNGDTYYYCSLIIDAEFEDI